MSLKKVSRAPGTPGFSTTSTLSPPTVCLEHFTSKMLTGEVAQNCQCRKMKWARTTHFFRAGRSQELHTISPEPPWGWILMKDESSQGSHSVCLSASLCMLLQKDTHTVGEPITLQNVTFAKSKTCHWNALKALYIRTISAKLQTSLSHFW